jgi:hypothetical protein
MDLSIPVQIARLSVSAQKPNPSQIGWHRIDKSEGGKGPDAQDNGKDK